MMKRPRGVSLLAALLVSVLIGCRDQQPTTPPAPVRVSLGAVAGGSSADVPAGSIALPTYVREGVTPQRTENMGIVRVYQDEQPWFGANRVHETLLSLDLELGNDYFIHPLADLQQGIPSQTTLVVITSNSSGDPAQAARQNHPAAQAALAAFLRQGGRLLVDMGDNLTEGGFIAPGATGTPNHLLPDPCWDATLNPRAREFRFAYNELDDDDLDTVGCYVAQGNLEQGITLPEDALPLMTAVFDGVPRIIMAAYCFEEVGLVILDTNTKEHIAQQPTGTGPTLVMQNLFAYALEGHSVHHPACEEPLPPPCEPVDVQLVAGNRLPPGTVDLSVPWLGVAILGSATHKIPRRLDPWIIREIRLGPWDTRGIIPTPAENFRFRDVNGDGRRDLLVTFDTERLLREGNLSPETTELKIWAWDDVLQLHCATTAVRVVNRCPHC